MEDSLDSLLEDAGLEGTGSEDGKHSISYYSVVWLCINWFCSLSTVLINAFFDPYIL